MVLAVQIRSTHLRLRLSSVSLHRRSCRRSTVGRHSRRGTRSHPATRTRALQPRAQRPRRWPQGATQTRGVRPSRKRPLRFPRAQSSSPRARASQGATIRRGCDVGVGRTRQGHCRRNRRDAAGRADALAFSSQPSCGVGGGRVKDDGGTTGRGRFWLAASPPAKSPGRRMGSASEPDSWGTTLRRAWRENPDRGGSARRMLELCREPRRYLRHLRQRPIVLTRTTSAPLAAPIGQRPKLGASAAKRRRGRTRVATEALPSRAASSCSGRRHTGRDCGLPDLHATEKAPSQSPKPSRFGRPRSSAAPLRRGPDRADASRARLCWRVGGGPERGARPR